MDCPRCQKPYATRYGLRMHLKVAHAVKLWLKRKRRRGSGSL